MISEKILNILFLMYILSTPDSGSIIAFIQLHKKIKDRTRVQKAGFLSNLKHRGKELC